METTIAINKAILHILDFNSNLTVFSENELDLGKSSVATFLMKHIEKAYCDSGAKPATFIPDSKFQEQLMMYGSINLSFVDFSVQIATLMYEAISRSDKLISADLLVCDLTINDEPVLALLKCNNRMGFTHQVTQGESGICNDIINHYAILPNPSQKLDEYAFIGIHSSDIRLVDKKCCIDGQDVFVLSDIVLQCRSQVSPKDTIGLVTSIARNVAENHGENSAIAVSRAKTYIIENTEGSEYLDPVELGKEVFAASPIMQQEYEQEVDLAGIARTVKIDKNLAVRTGRTHKIKTDTGIEISMPVDYFQNTDYVEFINNPDGTLSIALKNIGKLLSK
jgi:hypothetical protein